MDTEAIEFGTFPKLEAMFSIKRSTAYELLADGEIKSRYVRQRGSRTGVRLIDFASVREYLSRAPGEPTKEIVALKRKAALASAKKRAELAEEEAKKRAALNGNTG